MYYTLGSEQFFCLNQNVQLIPFGMYNANKNKNSRTSVNFSKALCNLRGKYFRYGIENTFIVQNLFLTSAQCRYFD